MLTIIITKLLKRNINTSWYMCHLVCACMAVLLTILRFLCPPSYITRIMLYFCLSLAFLGSRWSISSSNDRHHSFTGDLVKLQIEHDNSGFGAAWMLDHIEVTNLATNQRWAFPCGQWFDKKRGDGQISRELLPRD